MGSVTRGGCELGGRLRSQVGVDVKRPPAGGRTRTGWPLKEGGGGWV